MEYFKLFGEKSLCFSDLVPYLEFIGANKVTEVC